VIENMKSSENKYFVPFVWATTIVERASKEGKIKGEIAVQKVLNASTKLTHTLTYLLTYLIILFFLLPACWWISVIYRRFQRRIGYLQGAAKSIRF